MCFSSLRIVFVNKCMMQQQQQPGQHVTKTKIRKKKKKTNNKLGGNVNKLCLDPMLTIRSISRCSFLSLYWLKHEIVRFVYLFYFVFGFVLRALAFVNRFSAKQCVRVCLVLNNATDELNTTIDFSTLLSSRKLKCSTNGWRVPLLVPSTQPPSLPPLLLTHYQYYTLSARNALQSFGRWVYWWAQRVKWKLCSYYNLRMSISDTKRNKKREREKMEWVTARNVKKSECMRVDVSVYDKL